jgi:hypothetical protein
MFRAYFLLIIGVHLFPYLSASDKTEGCSESVQKLRRSTMKNTHSTRREDWNHASTLSLAIVSCLLLVLLPLSFSAGASAQSSNASSQRPLEKGKAAKKHGEAAANSRNHENTRETAGCVFDNSCSQSNNALPLPPPVTKPQRVVTPSTYTVTPSTYTVTPSTYTVTPSTSTVTQQKPVVTQQKPVVTQQRPVTPPKPVVPPPTHKVNTSVPPLK